MSKFRMVELDISSKFGLYKQRSDVRKSQLKKRSAAKERNQQFAILSALAAVFTVMGHTGVGIGSLDWLIHYDQYHMPLFIFISGYFFHTEDVLLFNTLSYIWKQLKRLVIPFFLWNLVYGCVAIALSQLVGITWCNVDLFWYELLIRPFTWGHGFFQLNAPSWFILALFEVKIINWFLRMLLKCMKCPEWIILCIYIMIASLAIYYARTLAQTAITVKITRALYLLLWFEVGIFYKNTLEERDTANNYCYFFVMFLFQFGLQMMCNGKELLAGVWNSEFYHCPGITILSAATGIAFFLRLSRILVPSFGQSSLIQYISKHTFSMMMHQMMGFTLLSLFYYLLTTLTGSETFDLYTFQTDPWYRYCPNNVYSFRILYVIAGTAFPLAGCWIWEKIRQLWKRHF